jgi:hypothetical protein
VSRKLAAGTGLADGVAGKKTTCDEDQRLINNRQNGRRRGRGGGPRSPNAPNPGNNRQDNRSRGNAAQLHEKYKAMARDSQLAGDRVQTEYYLQFADHYFRVLSEGRPRFEDQRPRRDDFMSDEDEYQDDNMNAQEGDEPQERDDRQDREQRPERAPREYRADREPRQDREQRPEREPRAEREQRPEREARPDRETRNGAEARPRRERPRRDREEQDEGQSEERISLEVLPPAISIDAGDGAAKPVRRRTTRRPRTEGGEEIAPAA